MDNSKKVSGVRRRSGTAKKIKRSIYVAICLALLSSLALIFMLPIAATISNSFMSSTEISANYGKVFANAASNSMSSGSAQKTYIAEKINLKLIPDMVSFSQWMTAIIKTPDYILKFWNSVILVLPIMVFQICVALGAAYCFSRFRGRLREVIFFVYIILMLMPYQVTLVPNYLVAKWLHTFNTRWAVILPGIFSPFSVFILTKFMRRIPSAMIEAAKLDGCGEWKIFTKICIPLCKSTIYSVAILVFIDYWNMVEQPLILMTGDSTELHPLSVFLSKVNTGDVGIAFAVATFYMIPPLLIFLYSEDYLIDGIAYSGGIKG